jgi:hypothetical protein
MTRIVFIFCLALTSAPLVSQSEPALVNELPNGISVRDIIQSFATKEKEFRQALEQYTYTREVTVAARCEGGQAEIYKLTVVITFDKKGNRVEKVKGEDSSLECIMITKEDLDAFRNQSLLVLTADEIQDYQINFAGQQQQEDSHFFVFDVAPISVQSGRQQFEGRIWVDSRDFFIVKTQGRIATKREKKRKEQENPLPALTTWREQIDGRYWFPTYSRANAVLHFPHSEVQIEELVKLTNYKAVAQPK